MLAGSRPRLSLSLSLGLCLSLCLSLGVLSLEGCLHVWLKLLRRMTRSWLKRHLVVLLLWLLVHWRCVYLVMNLIHGFFVRHCLRCQMDIVIVVVSFSIHLIVVIAIDSRRCSEWHDSFSLHRTTLPCLVDG